MKICYITSALDALAADGWERYSAGLIKAIKENHKVEIQILTAKNVKNDGNLKDYCCPLLPPVGNPLLKNLFWLSINYRKVKNIINDCDAVHCLVELYIPLAYILFRKKPFIITLHGTYGAQYLKNKKTAWLFRYIFKKAKVNICVSKFTKKMISPLAAANYTVIHNGINFNDFYRPGVTKHRTDQIFRILTVGALKYRKGYHLSIPAVAKAAKSIPNLEYIIVGDQADVNYFRFLKNLAEKSGIADKVRFLQNISDAELIDQYYNSDLFLLTPVSDLGEFEGYGLVYLEANACGLPVIGTTGSGAEESIKNNFSGLLVEPKVDNIANAILKLYSDNKLRESLSKTGIEWAKAKDWRNVAKEYAHLYGLE